MFLLNRLNRKFYLVIITIISLNISALLIYNCYNQDKVSTISVRLSYPECCKSARLLLYQKLLQPTTQNKPQSYCSWEATFNGQHQRVISYSLFKSNEKGEKKSWKEKLWKKGLTDNLERLRKYFPGWVIRVFSDLDDDEFICDLRCQNLDFFWCDIRNLGTYGDLSSQMDSRTWRFLPLGDPTVDVFLIRDVDSLLLARDAAAVQDWLQNTTKAFHAFRDHPAHVEPALGGLWGGNNVRLSAKLSMNLHKTIVNQSSLEGRHKKYFDQDVMLDQIIFPPNRDNFVHYDSYYCDKWRNQTLTRPFPTQRVGNEFLGEPVMWGGYGGHGLVECPESCRPEHGKSWKFC